MTAVDPPLCLALDVPDAATARTIVDELGDLIPVFKVGLELFCAEGPDVVRDIVSAGRIVMLDLKVHDIPRTAASAVRGAAACGASFLTIHAAGGTPMVRAAVRAARDAGTVELLAVTVLTSLDDADLREIGIDEGTTARAVRLALLAASQGVHGLVLSARDLPVVRPAVPDLLLATPGVRLPDGGPDDHRRVATLADAILGGSDLVIVGRPILDAPDRREAAAALVEDVRQAERQLMARPDREAQPAPIAEVEDVEYEDVER